MALSKKTPRLSALLLCLAAGLAQPLLAQAQDARAAAAHPTRAAWADMRATLPDVSSRGAERAVQARSFRAATLDRNLINSALARAPMEFTAAARTAPAVLSLPHPDGSFQRFAVVESPVMEAGLAAKHPHIKTYAGRGIDDPTATLRISVTQLGMHSSVRSRKGNWYVEPLYNADDSIYASYLRSEVPARLSGFAEQPMMQPMLSLQRGRYHAGNSVQLMGAGFAPNATVTIGVRQTGDQAVRQTITTTADARGSINASFTADPWRAVGSYELTASDGQAVSTSNYQVVPDGASLNAAVGTQLRTYRLAMVSDPAYANFHGAANVTAAKVTLMNRVNQVYEDDLSIRMVLINATDALNLNTTAQATGTNGPCGGAACFTAAQVASCSSGGLTANRTVAGLLAGAGNFDVGHLALGGNGGGIAGLGVVGLDGKARGCTGISPPTGDVWAIDFVAHELGHQYAGNHTFNGTQGNCSGGNRNAANSVEPGSGSSVMAYAGICGTDNIQANSDPYFSQRSFDEIFNHVNAAEQTLNELQQAALRSFGTAGQQFQLRLNGVDSAPIVAGTNYTTAGVKAAIEAIPGWPAGGTVTIGSLTNNGFTITYGGSLAGSDVPNLELVGCTEPCTGFVNDIVKGGATTRRGAVTATGNNPPSVTSPAGFTIPVRTPFALTGSATDPDGDTVTYMWEQNDRGASTGTALTAAVKTNGPLFRQFGERAVFNAGIYNPPGQNQVTTNPTRVFPDLVQILANQTNAETGNCSALTGDAQLNCNSEFLPTADYVGFAGVNASPARLNMRLTARDGRGGVNSADTVLTLAPGAGPFLVTYPNTSVTLRSESLQTITWNVANTDAAPVSAANVRISMSTDGGLTYPILLAASVPNTGSRQIIMPQVGTTQGRIRVEAVGNVFFDVSNANFTLDLVSDINLDGVINCADWNIVRGALGTSVGQPGFVPRADVNNSGTIDDRDVSYVASRLPTRSCPTPR
jgi:hypothetical protein